MGVSAFYGFCFDCGGFVILWCVELTLRICGLVVVSFAIQSFWFLLIAMFVEWLLVGLTFDVGLIGIGFMLGVCRWILC